MPHPINSDNSDQILEAADGSDDGGESEEAPGIMKVNDESGETVEDKLSVSAPVYCHYPPKTETGTQSDFLKMGVKSGRCEIRDSQVIGVHVNRRQEQPKVRRVAISRVTNNVYILHY
jgi:hypothetical protein